MCSPVRAMNSTVRRRSVAVLWSLFPRELSVGQVLSLSLLWRGHDCRAWAVVCASSQSIVAKYNPYNCFGCLSAKNTWSISHVNCYMYMYEVTTLVEGWLTIYHRHLSDWVLINCTWMDKSIVINLNIIVWHMFIFVMESSNRSIFIW